MFAEYIRYGQEHSEPVTWTGFPHSVFLHPIFQRLYPYQIDVVAILVVALAWERLLADLIPEHARGIFVVLRNSCGQSFTYTVDKNRVSLSISHF